MGILRSDRVSGLGGANAINGSAHFQGSDAGTAWLRYIDAGVSGDYNFGAGDFTIECWINREVATNDDVIWGTTLSESSGTGLFWYFNSSGNLRIVENGNTRQSTSNSISAGTWYHVALTRASGTLQMWVDGVSKYNAGSVTGNIGSSTQNFIIGDGNTGYAGNAYQFLGHISNLRIQKGKAEYTAAFTPPTTKLEVTPETVLLCCHDPGNVLAEATGKTLNLVKSESQTVGGNSAGIVASRFAPDVGEDHGTTFEDNTKFDTLSYMVPPGGTTTQRGRGRGVLGGGAPFVSPNVISNMQYIEVQSGGIFKDFGDLTVARGYFPAGQTASSTRGISAGGWTGSDNNTIDYITIATTSNATEFGDTVTARPSGGLSNQTRCVTAGDAGSLGNTIEYLTIASTGNGTDFGDLTEGRGLLAGVSSPTRGVFGGGRNNTPSSNTLKNTMEYITIASTGNSADFGDLSAIRYGQTGFSSSVRGIWAGGYLAPGQTKTIDYFAIATTGNASDFGDLSTNNGYCASVTNSIRGAVTINDAPNYYNTIEYITIATLGDAKDFGDSDPTGSGKGHGDFPSSMSDSHGGTT